MNPLNWTPFEATMILIGMLCIFVAGIAAGMAQRDRDHDEDEAGDTHAHLPPLPPMRTASARLIEQQSAAIARDTINRQRGRAGQSAAPLKPSYDGSKRAGPGQPMPDRRR